MLYATALLAVRPACVGGDARSDLFVRRTEPLLFQDFKSVRRPKRSDLASLCVGTGSVNFGQFDYALPRDSKFENQLYTRFVKFVKYGMCERCQSFYLERGAAQQPPGNKIGQQQMAQQRIGSLT